MEEIDRHKWRFPREGETTPPLCKAWYGEEPLICDECAAWGMAPRAPKTVYSLENMTCLERQTQQALLQVHTT